MVRRLIPTVIVLLLTLTLLHINPVPISAQESTPEAADPLDARLGGTRKAFEAVYGDPTELNGDCKTAGGCSANYAVEEFGQVRLVYARNRVVFLGLIAPRDTALNLAQPDPNDWSVEQAYLIGTTFLPADTKLDADDAYPNAAGAIVSPCRSKALAEAISAKTARTSGATGKAGDCDLVLNLNADGDVSMIFVRLGDGPAPGGLPALKKALAADEDAFLAQADVILLQALGTIDEFRTEIGQPQPDLNRINDLITYWQSALPFQLGEAPSTQLEPFVELFDTTAAELVTTADDIVAGLNGDQSRLQTIGTQLSSAEIHLGQLRDAVAAYRAV